MKLKRIKIKALNGFIFVEPYDKTRPYCNFYDENLQRFDYIATDWITKKEYNKICKEFSKTLDITNFLETKCVYNSYDYSQNLGNLIDNLFADETKTIYNDMKTMPENDFLLVYGINKIGNYYFKGEF